MNTDDLIVVKKKFEEEETELLIVKESWFKATNMCDCYDRYGQRCDCYNAGCYSLDNSASGAASAMLECLYKHFNVEYSENDIEVSRFDDTQNFENELLEGISKEDINSFIEEWKKDNENHTECEAYTYWDGHNHKTVVLSLDFGESDLERISEDEENEILEEYSKIENGKEIDFRTIYEGEKYNIMTSRWQGDWAIAYAELKDDE